MKLHPILFEKIGVIYQKGLSYLFKIKLYPMLFEKKIVFFTETVYLINRT